MKIRVTIMTENDKQIPEGYNKKEYEEIAKSAWTTLMNSIIFDKSEKAICEKAEIIE